MRIAAFDAQQLDVPALPLEMMEIACNGRAGRNAPTRCGGGGFSGELLFGKIAPTPQRESDDTAFAGDELKAPRGCQR